MRKKSEYGLAYGTQAACSGDEARTRFGSRTNRGLGQNPMKLFPLKDPPQQAAGFFIFKLPIQKSITFS